MNSCYLLVFGEVAPTSQKGVCQRHVNDIAGFLRCAHVTINVRHEGDVEEKVVFFKVSKSSGACYGFRKEKARRVEPFGPVGLVYKKADVRADIDANKRDKFWSDQEKLEKQRVQEERKVKIEEEKKRTVKSKRGRQERQLCGEREAERERSIDGQKAREREDYRRREEEDRAHYKARMEQLDAETEREKRQADEDRRRFKQQERETIGAAVRHIKETVAEREVATCQVEEEPQTLSMQ
ncbi:drebrin-like protein B [Corticium candelabrum]|uniref:drebrin-like protein B n=1 Tax=Corticium candelabrum TaxID=121492 RepID=UPI002E25ACEF|nr:drebrin-like protein B [Corticium candelabrum]